MTSFEQAGTCHRRAARARLAHGAHTRRRAGRLRPIVLKLKILHVCELPLAYVRALLPCQKLRQLGARELCAPMRYSGQKFGMIGRFRELLPVAEEGEEGARLVTALLRRALALLRTGGEPLAAAASWGTCSIGMTLLNKRAIDKTGAPLGVVVLQMLATVLVALSQHRRLPFGQGGPPTRHRPTCRCPLPVARGPAPNAPTPVTRAHHKARTAHAPPPPRSCSDGVARRPRGCGRAPRISPVSALYLPCICPVSALHLPCISPVSPLQARGCGRARCPSSSCA